MTIVKKTIDGILYNVNEEFFYSIVKSNKSPYDKREALFAHFDTKAFSDDINDSEEVPEKIIEIITQKDYDRKVVVIREENGNIIGLNFMQGMEDLDEEQQVACQYLTEIYKRLSSGNRGLRIIMSEIYTINKSIDLYCNAFIDIWTTSTTIRIPQEQKKLIIEALDFYRKDIKKAIICDADEHKCFDLITLKALMGYEVSSNLSFDDVRNFTHVNGVDIPEYN
jgi:hypothetical protein